MMLIRYKQVLAAIAVAFAAFTGSGIVEATPYLFTVSGSYNASFEIDSNPSPFVTSSDALFIISHSPVPQSFGHDVIFTFYNEAYNGGFDIIDLYTTRYITFFNGPQLYTGSESAPVLRLGTFDLSYPNGASATLNISSATAAVPEPATWALMVLGLGTIGWALRRRQSVESVVTTF